MPQKPACVISACLMGLPTRYDGKDNALPDAVIRTLSEHFMLIPVCPEQLGGLSTPRFTAEICKNGRVLDISGEDVSALFQNGAEYARRIAQITGSRFACMKSNSPSCGNHRVYDGTFSYILVPGKGIAVKEFEKYDIKVYNETEIDMLIGEQSHV
ncbi:MAG: DUF523 domain-containing protein [FCB group bacterium]|nr:DUF523 domain-containing protein [FCB group bacterium]